MLAKLKENNKYLIEVVLQIKKHFEVKNETNSLLFRQIELTLAKALPSEVELEVPMSVVDYYEERTAIQELFKSKLQELAKKYALSHNEVKIGDRVKSKQGDALIVENISFTCPQYELPQCVYRGPHITKRGELSKRKDNKIVIFKEQLQ